MKNHAPGLFLAAAALVTSACAAQPPPEYAGPEIPSREEVAEVTRGELPASKAAIAAVNAYKLRVCAEKPASSWGNEPPSGRGCRIGQHPINELSILDRLFKADPAAPDAPHILERMIALWTDLGVDAERECARVQLSPEATVGEIEKAQQTLYSLEKIQQQAQIQPIKLCAKLRSQYPSYVVRVSCPPAGDAPAQSISGDGWF